MATKIRLQRFGKKGKPFYHVVVADSRAPRDGKFIERIGSYNPNTNPATIVLDFDKAFDWINKGAQPTDTAKAILAYRGVLYKKHLQGGVKKGAFDEATADARFEEWLKAKEAKIQDKKDGLSKSSEEIRSAALAAEAKKKADKAAAVRAKNTPPAAEVEEEVVEEAPVAEVEEEVVKETPVAEVVEEAPVAEAAAEETPVAETPAAEEEVVVVAEEVAEEPAAEAALEAEATAPAEETAVEAEAPNEEGKSAKEEK